MQTSFKIFFILVGLLIITIICLALVSTPRIKTIPIYIGGMAVGGSIETEKESVSLDADIISNTFYPKEDVFDGEATTTKEAHFETEFSYKNTTSTVLVNLDGYNQCRMGVYGTSTLEFCQNFLREQINNNVKWAKEAMTAAQKVIPDYSMEINEEDF